MDYGKVPASRPAAAHRSEFKIRIGTHDQGNGGSFDKQKTGKTDQIEKPMGIVQEESIPDDRFTSQYIPQSHEQKDRQDDRH